MNREDIQSAIWVFEMKMVIVVLGVPVQTLYELVDVAVLGIDFPKARGRHEDIVPELHRDLVRVLSKRIYRSIGCRDRAVIGERGEDIVKNFAI